MWVKVRETRITIFIFHFSLCQQPPLLRLLSSYYIILRISESVVLLTFPIWIQLSKLPKSVFKLECLCSHQGKFTMNKIASYFFPHQVLIQILHLFGCMCSSSMVRLEINLSDDCHIKNNHFLLIRYVDTQIFTSARKNLFLNRTQATHLDPGFAPKLMHK